MGALRDLMVGDYYSKFAFLTDEQKGDGFYARARALSEDLVFLKILLRRNSISGFGFEITPMKSTMDFRFWRDLFHCSFGGHTEEDYVRKMLVDYYLVENKLQDHYNELKNYLLLIDDACDKIHMLLM